MKKHGREVNAAPTDREVFHGFVFNGQEYSPERIARAVQAAQPHLDSTELKTINDALLSRLDRAKKARRKLSKKEMLDDPAVNALVSALALVNTSWICSVIADNIEQKKHLRGFTVDELYSTALTGGGEVGGVTNAILQYDYKMSGVNAFTPYLAMAITNALQPTPKQVRTYIRVESRTRPIHRRDEDRTEPGWVDRTAPRPETAAVNRELLELVQSVIPHLPTHQQRVTAAWMIERILETGELPMQKEVARMQRPRVSIERGRQIMAATINSIRQQIEERYPQLAEGGINGWEEFRKVFKPRPAAQNAYASDGRSGRRG